MNGLRKIRHARVLIIYMVLALLFLTSFDLHIHVQEPSVTVDHGVAVDISSFSTGLTSESTNEEISVNPDSVLKVNQSNVHLLVIFLLIATLVTVLGQAFIHLLRERRTVFSVIPFYGTPSLRAPPQ